MTDKIEARELLYEGKAKKLFATADSDLILQYFKDDATAFNAKKRGTIRGKGVLNFWDSSSGEKMDKDRFRRDLGGIEEAYQEIARRVGA
jgi:phosphoribosylaminoimidazole-succinocarboxamide synthase